MRENSASPTSGEDRISDLTPTPVPLPSGADPDVFDDWDSGSRVVWSCPITLPLDPPGTTREWDIRVAVVQLADGSIVADGPDRPVIFLNGDEHKTVAGARALAAALNTAADLAELWARDARATPECGGSAS